MFEFYWMCFTGFLIAAKISLAFIPRPRATRLRSEADVTVPNCAPPQVESSLVKDQERRDPRSVRREALIIRALMTQLLTSLQKLHSVGIVHRDIKPQNIIFSQGASHICTMHIRTMHVVYVLYTHCIYTMYTLHG